MVLFLLLKQFFGRLSFCKERRKGESIPNPAGICSYVPAQGYGDCEAIGRAGERSSPLREKGAVLRRDAVSARRSFLRRGEGTISNAEVSFSPSQTLPLILLGWCVLKVYISAICSHHCQNKPMGRKAHLGGKSSFFPISLLHFFKIRAILI